MNYLGKPLEKYSLQQLKNILSGFEAALHHRNKVSQHEKFNKDKVVGNKKTPKMDFPKPNPEFLKLKLAIEEEIKNRKKIK